MEMSSRSFWKLMPGIGGFFLAARPKDRSVPFLYMGNGNGLFEMVGVWLLNALPAGRCTADLAGLLERLQRLAEPFVLDRQHLTKFHAGQRTLLGK